MHKASASQVLMHPRPTSPTNPYVPLLAEGLRGIGWKVDGFSTKGCLYPRTILHVHWPEHLFRSFDTRSGAIRLKTAVRVLQARDGALVWTVHNLVPHSALSAQAADFYEWFLRRVDGTVYLTDWSREVAISGNLKTIRSLPSVVAPHGLYDEVYPESPPQQIARAALRIPQAAKVYLFFGSLRVNKGIEHLENLAGSLSPNSYLIVAGRPNEHTRPMVDRLQGTPRVLVFPDYIEDDQVPLLFKASDCVLLPYDQMTNSGVAFLARTFEVPVVAKASRGAAGIRAEIGSRWVGLHEGLWSEVSVAGSVPLPTGETIEVPPWPEVARQVGSLYSTLV